MVADHADNKALAVAAEITVVVAEETIAVAAVVIAITATAAAATATTEWVAAAVTAAVVSKNVIDSTQSCIKRALHSAALFYF